MLQIPSFDSAEMDTSDVAAGTIRVYSSVVGLKFGSKIPGVHCKLASNAKVKPGRGHSTSMVSLRTTLKACGTLSTADPDRPGSLASKSGEGDPQAIAAGVVHVSRLGCGLFASDAKDVPAEDVPLTSVLDAGGLRWLTCDARSGLSTGKSEHATPSVDFVRAAGPRLRMPGSTAGVRGGTNPSSGLLSDAIIRGLGAGATAFGLKMRPIVTHGMTPQNSDHRYCHCLGQAIPS